MSDASHPKNRSVEEDVLASSKFRVKPGSDFQQAGYPAFVPNLSGRWFGNATEKLQQGRFASTVSTDNPYGFAVLNGKRYIL